MSYLLTRSYGVISPEDLHSKGEIVLVLTTKAYWWSRSLTPRILNLGARWRQVVTLTLSPQCLQNRRQDGP